MKFATIIALSSLLLSANAFHFPSRRFGAFNQPHFRQPSLFDQFPSHHRQAAQPTREQQEQAQQRQSRQRLAQLKGSEQQLTHQRHDLQAYKHRVTSGIAELETQYAEHQSYYQASLNELHPRSQRYAYVYRQAQAKLNEIQAQYRRYKQELSNTEAKLERLVQQLQRVEQDKQYLEQRLLTSQDLHGRTQESDAQEREQVHQQQQQQQEHHQHQNQHQQQQHQHQQQQHQQQPPHQPLPPQDPQELKRDTASPSAGTPRIFKKTIRKGGQAQPSSGVDIRSGVEFDDEGLPWQAGGIWTGLSDTSEQTTASEALLSDHDEHVMYMKELREYLYR